MYEILADVSIDIEKDFAEKYQIKYVPMEYVIGDETRPCVEPESIEYLHTYYDKLREAVPTKTSQITPFQYVEIFRPYVEAGTPLLYLCLSSGLSSTYQSALMAVSMLEEEYGNVNVQVVDSLGATGGMGLLTESAVLNREKGMSVEENAAWLKEHAGLVNYYFKVEDLMYLKRGGRVSATTAVVGTALNIKPILTINPVGKLDTVAKKRGSKMAIKWIVEKFTSNFDKNLSDTVYISCADCMKDAQALKEMILKVEPQLEVRITSLSPIIGAHTGPDMLALIYYGTDRG